MKAEALLPNGRFPRIDPPYTWAVHESLAESFGFVVYVPNSPSSETLRCNQSPIRPTPPKPDFRLVLLSKLR
jgi:hypothetical protein